MSDAQESETTPDNSRVRCAHSGETVPCSECVEIGGQMIHHKFKDQYVEALRQGVISTPTAASKSASRPRAVFWAGVFFSFAPFQLYLAYRSWRGGPQMYSTAWAFTIPSLFLLSAILIWFHGRRRLTYFVASFALLVALSRGLWSQLFPDSRFHGAERDMIPGLLLLIVLLWRFTFGDPSRSYFGVSKCA